MKKIFNFFGVILSVALMGAFAACTPQEQIDSADVGLGIKVFFPTKVVAGQPMTINGSGFSDVREIVFPNGVSVTDFEIVSNDMLRVVAPRGIANEGGKILVVTAEDQAESRQALTIGHPFVSGFSKQDGEEIGGGEQLTVYGQDLEFISRVELLDPDGNPLILEDEDFYRKGTSTVVITIPKKIFEGAWVGKMYTFDGQEIPLPELNYVPASDGGHWETVKTVVWEGDGSAGEANWNGTYRFGLDGHDGNNECIATFPQEIWDKIKSETFYVTVVGADPQIRVTTGWWSTTWTGNDFQPGNELLTDNGDGTWTLEVNFGDDAIVGMLDDQHLLFTGARFYVKEIFFNEEIWVDGGGHMEIVKTSIWKNDDPDGHGPANWNGTYRFAGEGHSTGEEIYEIPADLWEKMKTEKFYLLARGSDWVQMRIVTGWWSSQWPDANDITTGNEMIVDNGDGTYVIELDLSGSALAGAMDTEHLLFTGSGFTPLELYFQEEIWVDGGGDDGPKQVVFWENPGAGGVSWNGTYRFGLDGNDGNNECIATFPEDIWNKIKSGPFYIELIPNADWFNVRVTNGWWDTSWNVGDVGANSERMIDNGDGTYHIEINFSDDADFLGTVDQKHLLFTGEGYTPTKLYFQ